MSKQSNNKKIVQTSSKPTSYIPGVNQVGEIAKEVQSIGKVATSLPGVITETVGAVPGVLKAVVTAPLTLLKGVASLFTGEKEETTAVVAPPPQQIIKEIYIHPESKTAAQSSKSQLRDLKLVDILPNPAQPRKYFDEAKLQELAESIAREGVLEPILVRELRSGKFEIIAGERRFRAAKKAKLTKIPAIVKDVDSAAAYEISVIENIQRENLTPIEEAEAYRTLIEKYRCTQEEVAVKVKKSRSHVSHMLRLLTLPEPVLNQVQQGELTAAHAKTLVGQENAENLAAEIIRRKLPVREADKLSPAQHQKVVKDERIAILEKQLNEMFGLTVKIDPTRLTISYPSIDVLEERVRKVR